MEGAQRYGGPFCLLLIDIDHFIKVNVTYGHEAGAEMLGRLGGALHGGTRGIDTTARIGGDEFAVILTETDLAHGLEVADVSARSSISKTISTRAKKRPSPIT